MFAQLYFGICCLAFVMHPLFCVVGARDFLVLIEKIQLLEHVNKD